MAPFILPNFLKRKRVDSGIGDEPDLPRITLPPPENKDRCHGRMPDSSTPYHLDDFRYDPTGRWTVRYSDTIALVSDDELGDLLRLSASGRSSDPLPRPDNLMEVPVRQYSSEPSSVAPSILGQEGKEVAKGFRKKLLDTLGWQVKYREATFDADVPSKGVARHLAPEVPLQHLTKQRVEQQEAARHSVKKTGKLPDFRALTEEEELLELPAKYRIQRRMDQWEKENNQRLLRFAETVASSDFQRHRECRTIELEQTLHLINREEEPDIYCPCIVHPSGPGFSRRGSEPADLDHALLTMDHCIEDWRTRLPRKLPGSRELSVALNTQRHRRAAIAQEFNMDLRSIPREHEALTLVDTTSFLGTIDEEAAFAHHFPGITIHKHSPSLLAKPAHRLYNLLRKVSKKLTSGPRRLRTYATRRKCPPETPLVPEKLQGPIPQIGEAGPSNWRTNPRPPHGRDPNRIYNCEWAWPDATERYCEESERGVGAGVGPGEKTRYG
ncbi:hypothetical protein BDV97DRAFT_63349 [Delphinella strobiligena]|nr:hypothetical protein BDV97DRAFT_63349 [Delphinella strobiligena]